ncbi:MAG: ATP-binding protein [Candidatus Heimdallarchaeaceae archaeon]
MKLKLPVKMIVLGIPRTGKTTLLIKLAEEIAAKTNYKVRFFGVDKFPKRTDKIKNFTLAEWHKLLRERKNTVIFIDETEHIFKGNIRNHPIVNFLNTCEKNNTSIIMCTHYHTNLPLPVRVAVSNFVVFRLPIGRARSFVKEIGLSSEKALEISELGEGEYIFTDLRVFEYGEVELDSFTPEEVEI